MTKKIMIFVSIYFALLLLSREFYANSLKSRWEVKRKSWLEERIVSSFKQKISGHFIYYSITGSPMPPNSKLKKYTESLNLWLIFSFNYFHFQLFFNLFTRKNKRIIKKYFLCLPFVFHPSIFRIQTIQLIKRFVPKFKRLAIPIAFILSALLGHFFESPQSFVLSFGFLGMSHYLFFEKKIDEHLFLALLIILYSLVFQKDFSFLGFLFSIFFIAFFKKTYVIFLMTFFTAFWIGHLYWISYPIDILFLKIIPFFHKLSLHTQSLATGWIATQIFLYFIHKKLTWLFLSAILFIDFAQCPTFILK